jgi:N-acetylneuraminic acid mutarotase
MPVGAAGGASALIGGTKLIYAGGTTWVDGSKRWLRDVRQYDLAGRSWNDGPSLPEALAYGGWVAGSDGVEIFGGMSGSGPSKNCWRLDPGLKEWTRTSDLPQSAVLGRVEGVRGVAYLFGGCSDVNAPMHCSEDVWMREASGKWTRVSRMPDGPVAVQAGAVEDGHIYLFGGCFEVPGGVVNRDDAYRYDPATREWQKLRSLPVAGRGISAANIGGGRILLAGGYTASAHDAASFGPEYGFSQKVWIYHTGEDRYESATPLPFGVSGIEIAIHEGTIVALGGEDRMRGRSRRCIQGKVE